ncbi:MAG TPA: GatB/YqeY domain-containing protein [Mycobacteriales bacterium]|nr:GatB/YqeY domain-containing protein [Mycobacteriales bacterium]
MSEDLRGRLRGALADALKQRDTLRIRVLRITLAAIDNAEAPAVDPASLGGVAIERSPRGVGAGEIARNPLTADEVIAVLRREIGYRLDAAADYESSGQTERAAQLRAEAAVLSDLGASAM